MHVVMTFKQQLRQLRRVGTVCVGRPRVHVVRMIPTHGIGHAQIGQQLFVSNAELIREIVRQDDVVCRSIVRMTLRGACASAIREGLDAVYDAVASEFEFVELVDETTPQEDYETLAGEPTSLGAFLKNINGAIADAPDDARRSMLQRAREIGLAAYRGHELPIPGAGRVVP